MSPTNQQILRVPAGIAVAILLLLTAAPSAQAQLVGTDAFMQGMHHEVGISRCGVFGSSVLPGATMGPFGTYHPTGGLPGLGFVADPDVDGWATGFPLYCGDYFVPGSPVEGWAVTFGDGTATQLMNTDQPCNSYDIPGGITSYNDAGAAQTVVWEGTATWPTGETVDITQTTILPIDKLYFVTQVTFCNTGTSGINDFYYCRNVDPDNDQPWSGDFTTFNEIIYQPPTDTQALVTAEGLTFGCFIGLGARDTMARVSYGSFNTGDPYDVWNASGPYSGSGSNTADEAISIAYKIPLLDTGECRCFAFAYILDEDDLEDALDATVSVGVLADGVDISSTGETTICKGDSVELQLLGADDFSWIWSPDVNLNVDSGTIVLASPDTTTTYTAFGTSPFCGDAVRTITIFVDSTFLGISAGADKFICPGASTTLDGSGAFSYSWSPPVSLSDPSIANPTASPSSTTTYFLTGTSEDGCSAEDSVVVTVFDLPTVTATSLDDEICIGDATTLEADGAIDYTWSPSTGLDPTIGTPVDADPMTTTTYTVVGTDGNGCQNSASLTLIVNPLPDVEATATPSTIDIVIDENATLSALPNGGISYTWSPTDGLLGDPNQQNVTAQPNDTTTYIVIVTDANGCTSSDTVTLNVIGEYDTGIPTAFSPNGDGRNDTWAPIVIGISADRGLVDFTIYNRWGEQVFYSQDRFNGWNGEYKGEPQEVGSYVVIVRSRVFGEEIIENKTIHLVR